MRPCSLKQRPTQVEARGPWGGSRVSGWMSSCCTGDAERSRGECVGAHGRLLSSSLRQAAGRKGGYPRKHTDVWGWIEGHES